MPAILERLKQTGVPAIFAKLAAKGLAQTVKILRRGAAASDGYGGETATVSESSPLPCLYEARTGNSKYVEGGEWTEHKITMPKTAGDGSAVEINVKDRLRLLKADGSDDLLFEVLDIRGREDSGVMLEINCALEN